MVKEPVDPFEKNPTLDVAKSMITGRKRRNRASKQTPSERRRISETWSARIGEDIKSEIQDLVDRTGRDNGYVGRALFRYALDALERGELVINAQNEFVAKSMESWLNGKGGALDAPG